MKTPVCKVVKGECDIHKSIERENAKKEGKGGTIKSFSEYTNDGEADFPK